MMKVPDSVSAMVYTMKHPHMWTLMVWAIAATGYVLMCKMSDEYVPVAFVACCALAFVGVMPLVRNERNTLHNIMGVVAGVVSQLWCVLVAGIGPMVAWWWLYAVVLTCMLCLGCGRKWCLVAELWCMAGVALVLYCNC